ncbi:MAG: VTT domain-containing protein [Planctomycetes bacterium]|nr:VTT domain-containing protein [Planctomycetota bacterium]
MLPPIARLRQLGPFGLLLLAAAALPLVGSAVLLAYTPVVEPHLRAAGIEGLVALALATAVLCGLALMNTQVLALFAGYVLGLWTGLGTVYVGILGAAVLSFLIARRITGPAFLASVEASPRAAAIHAALVRDPRGALTTTALLRLSPVVPFALVGVVLAAARVRAGAYFVGTALGVVPRTALVAYAGSELAAFDPEAGPAGAVKLGLAVVATLVLFVWIGYAARRALRRRVA